MDTNLVKYKSYNARSADLREQLHFCTPEQKIKSIQLHCSDAYGANTWLLFSQGAESFYKSYNYQMKMCYNLPVMTHTNIIEQVLCADQLSLRKQVQSRYVGFIKALIRSPSKEIRILSNLAIYDHRSTTCRNISYLNEITGLYVLCESKWRVRAALPNQSSVPVETWRSSLLLKLLEIRNNYSYKDMKITYEQTNEMINSLCIS